jgi:hypothetical protein
MAIRCLGDMTAMAIYRLFGKIRAITKIMPQEVLGAE